MTENNNNDKNEAGDERPERVVGTPSASAEKRVVSEQPAENESGHAGPFEPSETHLRSEEQMRRGDKMASAWFIIATLAGIAFIASYFVFPPNSSGEPMIADPQIAQYSNMLLGGTLTLAMFGIGAGMTVWARNVMPHYEVHSPYDELPSSDEEKGSFSEFFMKGADESGFTKRPLMRRTLLASMIPLGIAPVVLLRDLGPVPRDVMHHTPWENGRRMYIEGTHRALRAEDLENDPNGMISALPAIDDPDYPHGISLTDQAKSVILLIKVPEDDWKDGMNEPVSEGTDETHLNWTYNGIVAYSKICTHVGCPAALYERTTHRILCPCHQSTFDATDAAKVVFGPAHRGLPQLPIGVDDEGYLISTGDFNEPTGPTFWEYQGGGGS